MAESQGVEPCDDITTVYGLAIRCITILPALELVEAVRFELTDRCQSSVFKTGAINQALPRFLIWC